MQNYYIFSNEGDQKRINFCVEMDIETLELANERMSQLKQENPNVEYKIYQQVLIVSWVDKFGDEYIPEACSFNTIESRDRFVETMKNEFPDMVFYFKQDFVDFG